MTTTTEYLALQSWLHLRHGRTDEAILLLEGLSVLTPGDSWVNRTLSYAYLKSGQYQACLDQLQRCLQTQNSRTSKLIKARALWGLGLHEEARQLLKRMGGKLRDES